MPAYIGLGVRISLAYTADAPHPGLANAGGSDRLSADSVHKVFSSTFETIPTRRGVDPFRIAPAYAIGAGIHSIRAGRH